MTVTLQYTEDDMLVATRAFLLSILPDGVEVIQGQANRVPEPMAADFIVMTPMTRKQMATNIDSWTHDPDIPPVELAHAQSTLVTVQLDLHGPNGSDYAQVVATLARDYYGTDAVTPAAIQPCYAEDGMQMPFVNAAGQWENRWVVKLILSVSPIVSTTQEFADTVTPILYPVGG